MKALICISNINKLRYTYMKIRLKQYLIAFICTSGLVVTAIHKRRHVDRLNRRSRQNVTYVRHIFTSLILKVRSGTVYFAQCFLENKKFKKPNFFKWKCKNCRKLIYGVCCLGYFWPFYHTCILTS